MYDHKTFTVHDHMPFIPNEDSLTNAKKSIKRNNCYVKVGFNDKE